MSHRTPFARSLAVRLVSPLAVALALLCAVGVVVLGNTVRSEGKRDLSERAEIIAGTLAYNAELPLLARDVGGLKALLDGAARTRDVSSAAVLDASGRVVASVVADKHAAGERAMLVVEKPVETASSGTGRDEGAFALDTPGNETKHAIGSVRLVMSTESTDERTRGLQAQIAAGAAILLALTIGLGVFIARIVSGPLGRLVAATARVARGEASVRVPVSSRDEVGELAEAFNVMAQDLEKTRADLDAERRALEDRVAARTAELSRAQETLIHSEKLTAVGQLVAGVAHELNNPLTVVLGNAALLMERIKDEDLRRRLQTVVSAADSSRKIVQNLLAFARKRSPERSAMSLNEVVQQTIGLRAYHLRSEKIRVETELDPSLPKVSADVQQVQQVILNLLVNAEQAIEDAGRGDRIKFSTKRDDERVVLTIEDNGPGMPPDVRNRIFEPFFTTKEVGRGTGLGLSICYGIISEHDGDIRVESEPGQFTRFTIALPLVAHVEAKPAEPSAAQVAEIAEALRILVIDDDPTILDLVTAALDGSGATVSAARGGREAMGVLAKGERFDMILSDMRMPDVDGSGVYRYLKEHRPELVDKLVFATGDIANAKSVAFLESAGRPILTKPFSIAALRETVARVAKTR
ncbi:MAG TPA: ATP-binding protein [Candidatus Polarisedimenticolaceae bacterium]|nr:ATP-binding protein [Candidatus Polarisedimenticolaceae bacterium]